MNKTKKALVLKTLKKLPTGAHLMQLITNLVSWTGQEKKKKKKKQSFSATGQEMSSNRQNKRGVVSVAQDKGKSCEGGRIRKKSYEASIAKVLSAS